MVNNNAHVDLPFPYHHLNSLLNRDQQAFLIAEPLWDSHGTISDFTVVFESEAWREQYETDRMNGKPISDIPTLSPLLGAYKKVVQTGTNLSGIIHENNTEQELGAMRIQQNTLLIYIPQEKNETHISYSQGHPILPIEQNLDMITRWDTEGRLLYANKRMEEKTGIPRKLLYGKTKMEMGMSSDIAHSWTEAIKKVIKTGLYTNHYNYLLGKNKKIELFTRLIPEKNKQGHITSILAISRDITELKEIEQELQEKNKNLEDTQKLGKIGSFFYDMWNEKMRWSNELYCIMGLEPTSKIENDEALSFFTKQDKEELILLLNESLRTGNDFEKYADFIPKGKGEIHTLFIRAELVKNEKGNVLGIQGVVQDITDYLRIQHELIHTKDLLNLELTKEKQDVLKNTPDNGKITGINPLYINLTELELTDFSKAFSQQHGLENGVRCENIQEWLARIHPEDREKTALDLKKTLQANYVHYESAYRIIYPKEKNIRWVVAKAGINRTKDGKPAHLTGVEVDISALKWREEKQKNGHLPIEEKKHSQAAELKKNNDLLESILKVSLTSIAYFQAVRNKQGKIIDFKCTFSNEKPIGRKKRNPTGKRFYDLFDKHEDTSIFDCYVKALEEDRPNDFDICYQHDTMDNWYRIAVVKLDDGVVSSWEEITERKKVENALKDKNDILEAVQKAALTGLQIFKQITDKEGSIIDFEWTYVTKKIEEFTGLGELTGKRLSQWVKGNSLLDTYKQVMQSTETLSFEQEIKIGNKSHWFEVYGINHGKYLVLAMEDITKCKESELHVMEKNSLLSLIEQEYTIATWRWDIEKNAFDLSKAFYRIHQLEPDHLKFTYQDFRKLIHTDDRKKLDILMNKALSSKESFYFDYRVPHPREDKLISVSGLAYVICNENEEVVSVLGITKEIKN